MPAQRKCRLPETPSTKNNKGSRRCLHAGTVPRCCARRAGHRAHCGFSPRPNIVCALLGECPSRAVRTTASSYWISGSSPLLDGYDEPEILLYSTQLFCLTGADAEHDGKAARGLADGAVGRRNAEIL